MALLLLFGGSHAYQATGGSPAALAQFSFLKCPLNFVFDIVCPSCGMTRSVLAATQGQWQSSFDYHPLGIPFLSLVVVGTMLMWLTPKTLVQWRKQLQAPGQGVRLAGSGALVIYAFWGFLLR